MKNIIELEIKKDEDKFIGKVSKHKSFKKGLQVLVEKQRKNGVRLFF
jgi:hypothetical protein